MPATTHLPAKKYRDLRNIPQYYNFYIKKELMHRKDSFIRIEFGL